MISAWSRDAGPVEDLFEPLQPDGTISFTEWSFIADRAELDEVAQPEARVSFAEWGFVADQAELDEVVAPVPA